MSADPLSTAGTNRRKRVARHDEQLAGYETGSDAPVRAASAAFERSHDADAVILVEGISDQVAIDAVAARLGTDLVEQRVVVIPIGGASAVAHSLSMIQTPTLTRVIGLCDHAELEQFGQPFAEHPTTSVDNVFVCDRDLEDELLRCIDPTDLEQILHEQRELKSFNTMQKQPTWRDRELSDQMHRWLRSHARRSSRYAKLIIGAAEYERLPRPLVDVVQAARCERAR